MNNDDVVTELVTNDASLFIEKRGRGEYVLIVEDSITDIAIALSPMDLMALLADLAHHLRNGEVFIY